MNFVFDEFEYGVEIRTHPRDGREIRNRAIASHAPGVSDPAPSVMELVNTRTHRTHTSGVGVCARVPAPHPARASGGMHVCVRAS